MCLRNRGEENLHQTASKNKILEEKIGDTKKSEIISGANFENVAAGKQRDKVGQPLSLNNDDDQQAGNDTLPNLLHYLQKRYLLV